MLVRRSWCQLKKLIGALMADESNGVFVAAHVVTLSLGPLFSQEHDGPLQLLRGASYVPSIHCDLHTLFHIQSSGRFFSLAWEVED